MGGHMLTRKIMRLGYFWLTMETDYCQFVHKCPECQMHGILFMYHLRVACFDIAMAILRATPYSLVYGMKVVLPVEIEMGSLRVALESRPSWSGPYVIRELTPEGAAWLTDLDGNQFLEPTNVDQLKKYYI
ncbi:hypothetical protein CK203_037948 [Vitis vinifera]|uniref:Integrase zinc-binding domain-containing protein n=1 Tax=Vitis vinifera TaxID=29760 RepID=A0A438HNV9_VITVI|nr:hypothetical protein CK203_037948 [Vitis vinifera]